PIRRPLHLGHHRGYLTESVRADLRDMIRPILTEIGLFLTPFAIYAAFLIATRAGVLDAQSWALRRVPGPVSVSLLLIVGGFFLLAQFTGAPPGSTYIPAHIDADGKFVPGTTR